jgi:hypothetical protein
MSSPNGSLNRDEMRLLLEPETVGRCLHHVSLAPDLAVIGGGVAGVCAAITAAREGVRVTLVQDRPVLGGNASSEVRLWMLGATSHMGNNNRWARESGVVGEIMLENLYRNPEGNPLMFDALLLELVAAEPNIELLLNTAVYDIAKSTPDRIDAVRAFCSQNSTQYTVTARLFMDCSGDGIASFLAGAAFRMGAEVQDEFGEKLAPTGDFGYKLGHSMYFYSKDAGRPVNFVKPAFADVDIEKIRPYRSFDLKDQGCKFWWVEYGGRCDTVHDSEKIKWQLWKVVYGIWDYIKNSGKFPGAETYTLEWVGTIPGKRESRRFEGLTMITQRDIIEQRRHADAVAFGGWALDLHPADGVFSPMKPCLQYHSRGVFQIPLGATLSRNLSNLAFGGRIISATHVAFGSTRVMATCGYLAQATAVALVHALEHNIPVQRLVDEVHIGAVQRRLQRTGQHIPEFPFRDVEDLATQASVTTSSALALTGFPADGPGQPLHVSCAMLLPVRAGRLPAASIEATASQPTSLTVQLRISDRPGNFTPETILEERVIAVREGTQTVGFAFEVELPTDCYVFVCFLKNPDVVLANSTKRVTGVLSVFNGTNKAVSNSGRQSPPGDLGVDTFEFWCPQRRPGGHNLAVSFSDPLYVFAADELASGFERPTVRPNAWVADPADAAPEITLEWRSPQTIRKVVLALDTDFDHAMESVLMGHPESVMPFCVRDIALLDGAGRCVAEVIANHHTRVIFELGTPLQTSLLKLRIAHPSTDVPAALFAVHCYT